MYSSLNIKTEKQLILSHFNLEHFANERFGFIWFRESIQSRI